MGIPMGTWDVIAMVKNPGSPQFVWGPSWMQLALEVETSEDIMISTGLHRGRMAGVVSMLPPFSSAWTICVDNN